MTVWGGISRGVYEVDRAFIVPLFHHSNSPPEFIYYSPPLNSPADVVSWWLTEGNIFRIKYKEKETGGGRRKKKHIYAPSTRGQVDICSWKNQVLHYSPSNINCISMFSTFNFQELRFTTCNLTLAFVSIIIFNTSIIIIIKTYHLQ